MSNNKFELPDIEEVTPVKLKQKVSFSISFESIRKLINKVKNYVRKS